MKKRRGYIFTNKKHSYRAVMAAILGAISLISLIVVTVQAYAAAGDAQTRAGFTGLFAAVFSIVGLVLSLMTIQEKVHLKFFSVLGIVLNGIVLLWIGLILYMGGQ